MKINKYKRFVLETNLNEFVLESQLLVGKDYLSILKSINTTDITSESDLLVYDLTKDLLFMVNKDFSSPVNSLDITDNGLISFIPEDKIEYNDVTISYRDIIEHNDILEKLGIPLKYLKNKETLNKDLKNSYKVIKRIDVNNTNIDINGSYINRIIYYLQNNIDSETFVVISTYYNVSPFINNKKLPENRRSEAKIGRIIRKLLNSDTKLKDKYSDSTIEKFINIFSSHDMERKEIFDNFKIVEGESIRKWYAENSYRKVSGELGNSCMRFKKCQSYLDIYTDNPEVCKLLVLLDDQEKLIGRALLWTLIDGVKVIDRIYTIKDSLSQLFLRWSDNNGYKTLESWKQSSVKVKPIKYSKYPYMDNFCYYLPEKGILTNQYDFSAFKNSKKYKNSLLNAIKNPSILINKSTYKKTPKELDLLLIINNLDGNSVSSYV